MDSLRRMTITFLNVYMNSHKVIVKIPKKKKFSQNQLKLDCLSFHATGKTGLKKNIIGSSQLYLVLDNGLSLLILRQGPKEEQKTFSPDYSRALSCGLEVSTSSSSLRTMQQKRIKERQINAQNKGTDLKLCASLAS